MTNDSSTVRNSVSEPALLERARLALQSLQFEEEAARYRAACSELMEAIADAEAGNEVPLKLWLDTRRNRVDVAVGTPPVPHRTTSLTAPHPSTKTPEIAEPEESPWTSMQIAAQRRAESWFATSEETATQEVEAVTEEWIALLASEGATESSAGPVKKRQRIPLHLLVSIAVHAILLVVLGWWVVSNVQKQQVLSISSSSSDMEDVFLETVAESTPMDTNSEASEAPAALTDLSDLHAQIPTISAIDYSATGPALAETTMSASSIGALNAKGTGTQLTEGAEFFGSKAAGNSFVFVVDCSPSMARDGAFDEAKAEILHSLKALQPKQRFHIFFFAKEVFPIQFPGKEPEQYMLRADAENLDRTVQWLQRVGIQKDGRPPIEALRQAIAMQPDGIFVLFDGDTKVDTWTKQVREMNRSEDLLSMGELKVPIHVVHFFRDEFTSAMKRLAEENEGSYRFVPRPSKGGPR